MGQVKLTVVQITLDQDSVKCDLIICENIFVTWKFSTDGIILKNATTQTMYMKWQMTYSGKRCVSGKWCVSEK